jgi:hypothetical protein
MVGFAEVLQQTPLTVMDAPPSFVMFPPVVAVVVVMEDAAVVVRVGSDNVSLTQRTLNPSGLP